MKIRLNPFANPSHLLLLALFPFSGAVPAEEELVDTTWGENGRFHSPGVFLEGGIASSLRLGRDSQGRIVEAVNLAGEILIRRMDSSLQPDASFGESGLAALRSPVSGTLNSLELAMVPSGANIDSIVVATHAQYKSDCQVGRLQADSRTAPAFGRLGLRRPSLPGDAPRCRDLAVDADSIYLLFSYWVDNSQRLGVAKFDHDLNPRTEFGSLGVVLFQQTFQNRASRLSVSDGRIVIGAAPIQLQLFQLMADSGQPDPTFGDSGAWTPPRFRELAAEVWDVQHRGQDIVVLYALSESSSRGAFLRRFSATGQPQLSFGDPSSGRCTLIPGGLAPFQGLDAFEGLLAQDGSSLKALVASAVPIYGYRPRVFGADADSCHLSGPFATGVELVPSGSPDNLSDLGDLLPLGPNLLSTYSKLNFLPGAATTAGRVLSAEGADASGLTYPPLPGRRRSANQILDVGLQGGRLVFAGKGNFDMGYLTAAEASGALASGFGADGSVALPIDIGVSWLNMAAHVGPTSTVFAGTAYAIPGQRGLDEPIAPVFYKLDADAQPDQNFGENGVAQPPTGANGTDIRAVTQYGARIVALGRDSYYGPKYAVLYRLLADGNLDTDFGSAGVVRFAGGVRESDELTRVATTANRVFTAGTVEGSPRLVLYLFDHNGAPVNVGNPEGRIELHAPGLASGGWQLDLLADGDAVVLAAYTYNGSNNNDLKLWRILADGSLDPDFGTAGVRTLPAGWIANSRLWLGRDQGRILVSFSQAPAGSLPQTARFKATLLVLDTNGAPDASVGNGGRYEVDFDPGFAGNAARPLSTPERFLLSGSGENSAIALRKAQGSRIFGDGFE